jgi:hypothetical protein
MLAGYRVWCQKDRTIGDLNAMPAAQPCKGPLFAGANLPKMISQHTKSSGESRTPGNISPESNPIQPSQVG